MVCSQLETNSKRAAKVRRMIGEDGLREIKEFEPKTFIDQYELMM